METYMSVICFQSCVRSAFCTISGQPQGCTRVLVMRAQIWQSRKCVHRVYKPQHCPTLKPNALPASSMGHPSAQEKATGRDMSKLLAFHIFFSLRQMIFGWSKQMIQKAKQHVSGESSVAETAYLLCDCCLACWGSLLAYASSVN